MTSRHIFVLGSVNNQRDKRGEVMRFFYQYLCFISFFYAHNLLNSKSKATKRNLGRTLFNKFLFVSNRRQEGREISLQKMTKRVQPFFRVQNQHGEPTLHTNLTQFILVVIQKVDNFINQHGSILGCMFLKYVT